MDDLLRQPPEWRQLGDDEREFLAEQYEAYRDRLIADGRTKALEAFERSWERAYGYKGPMESVISDIQEWYNG